WICSPRASRSPAWSESHSSINCEALISVWVLKAEDHQDHVLPERQGLGKGAFIPAEPAAKGQGDVLLAIDRIGHRRPGEGGPGLEAPKLLHGVLVVGRYLAHDIAHEDEAAVSAQHSGIGRIVGLQLLHGVAGADIDPAEKAVADLAVGIEDVPHDRLD